MGEHKHEAPPPTVIAAFLRAIRTRLDLVLTVETLHLIVTCLAVFGILAHLGIGGGEGH